MQDEDGKTFLHYVCEKNDTTIAKLLIDANPHLNPDIQDRMGMTPLHYACLHANYELVKVLIRKNANLNLQNNNRKTPLHVICINLAGLSLIDPNIQSMLSFVDIKANLSLAFSDIKIVNFLIKNGAQVDLQDKNGMAPLHFACKKADIAVVQLLIDENANMHLRDSLGYSPLDLTRSNPLSLANLELYKEIETLLINGVTS